MPDKPKRGLSNEQWADARAKFEQGMAIAAISKEFGIRWNTINDRAKREGWTVEPSVDVNGHTGETLKANVQKRAQATVISMATRQVVEQAANDGTLDALAGEIRNGLLRHAEIETLLLDVAVLTLQKALGQNGKRLRRGKVSSEASELRDAIAAAGAAVDKSREIAGKKAGQPSVPSEDTAKPRTLEFYVPEPGQTSEAS